MRPTFFQLMQQLQPYNWFCLQTGAAGGGSRLQGKTCLLFPLQVALPTWRAAPGGRLAWPLRHEPDADQRLDAQAEACCATTGG